MQYMIRAGVVLALLSALAVPSYAATSTTLQNAVAADGNGTAASVYDTGLVGLQVTITGKARVDFEGSSDGGTTYAGIICLRSGSTGGYVSNTSASGMYHCNVPGLSNIRTPVVGWQTGTVTVVSNALTAPHNVLLAGEDQTNNVIRVEGQFSYKKIPHADTQVKASAGFLHTLSCVSDAAATAGSIVLYDNTAESGTEILNMALGAVPYQFSLVLDVVFATGLYVGYTTTADVDCVVSYR